MEKMKASKEIVQPLIDLVAPAASKKTHEGASRCCGGDDRCQIEV